MREGRVFRGYQEGDITFLPTYKYDNGTDVYDTSEKQRIPGWTDRILFKGQQLKQLQYSRAQLYTSDHRPVLALFEANIVTLDHEAKSKLQNELYQSLSSIEVRALPAATAPPDLPKRKLTTPIPTATAASTQPLFNNNQPIAASNSSTKLSDSFVDTLIDISFDTDDCK